MGIYFENHVQSDFRRICWPINEYAKRMHYPYYGQFDWNMQLKWNWYFLSLIVLLCLLHQLYKSIPVSPMWLRLLLIYNWYLIFELFIINILYMHKSKVIYVCVCKIYINIERIAVLLFSFLWGSNFFRIISASILVCISII